mmetsp:Transcript_1461/g.3263  ORF Transcript_1461/g.3263 Transcript_1461/m.3263 type:complete len:409 (-) Transcript_1461:53-1279(-)
MAGSTSKRLYGLVCLAAVIVIWVSSSELIQFIFDSVDFERPLFLTFYSTSLFSVYLLGFLFCRDWWINPDEEPPGMDTEGLLAPEYPPPSQQANEAPPPGQYAKVTMRSSENFASFASLASLYQPVTTMLPAAEVAKLAASFVPFWFAANWTFNASLCIKCGTGTSVASNTIVSSTSSLFTLILSILFLKEAPTLLKFACVLLSFGGVTLVTENDGSSHDHTSMVGDLLALAGAVLFGCYSVLLKRLIPDETLVNMPMFFGFLGLINGVLCIPLLALFHFTGWERFEPAPLSVFGFLTLNGLIGTVLSDLLWAKAVVLTSPLTVNLGMSLTIPLSFLADFITPGAQKPTIRWEYLLGAALVLLSFIGINSGDVAAEDAGTVEMDGSRDAQPSSRAPDDADNLGDLEDA